MTIEHKITVPDDADVTLTVKTNVAELRHLSAAVREYLKEPRNYRTCLSGFLTTINSVIAKAESNIYTHSPSKQE